MLLAKDFYDGPEVSVLLDEFEAAVHSTKKVGPTERKDVDFFHQVDPGHRGPDVDRASSLEVAERKDKSVQSPNSLFITFPSPFCPTLSSAVGRGMTSNIFSQVLTSRQLSTIGLPPGLVATLAGAGYETVSDLAGTSESELAQGGLSNRRWTIRNALLNSLPFRTLASLTLASDSPSLPAGVFPPSGILQSTPSFISCTGVTTTITVSLGPPR